MDVICIQCGVPFQAPPSWVKRGGGKFCSAECYAAHQREHPHTKRGKIAQPGVDHVCEYCGKAFHTDARRAHQGFCSVKCRKSATRPAKVCPTCGKEFSAFPGQGNRIYCSSACSSKGHLRRFIKCARCGKIVHTKYQNRKYCSEECHRPPVITVCPTCGKSFRAQPSTNQKFCSVRCYRAFTGETEPERNVRACLERLGVRFLSEHSFPGWRYPVDFYLPEFDTVLEVDSEYWHGRKSVRERDARKTLWLQSRGHTVIRISDAGLYGAITDGMLSYIRAAVHLPDQAIPQSSMAGLYPIQLSLPFNE